MTKLIIVRHAEAEGNAERRFHGFYNSVVTVKGYYQIDLLTKYLEGFKIDVIYSSDLNRTMETIRPIAKIKGLEIHETPGLREICGGEWEDVPWHELPVRFGESYNVWLNQPHLLQMPGGESMEEFQKRLVVTVTKIIEQNRGKNILISTHGTAIRGLQCYFHGHSFEKLGEIEWVDNTAVTIVDAHDNGSFNIALEGANAHLQGSGTIENQEWFIKKKEEKNAKRS